MSKSAQGSGPMRKSLDSPSTSVWGTSTGRSPESGQSMGNMFGINVVKVLVCEPGAAVSAGLTETGTGSTLKSSYSYITDLSDSEDFGNKQ